MIRIERRYESEGLTDSILKLRRPSTDASVTDLIVFCLQRDPLAIKWRRREGDWDVDEDRWILYIGSICAVNLVTGKDVPKRCAPQHPSKREVVQKLDSLCQLWDWNVGSA